MKIYDFKDATAPMTVDHRVYSTAQLSVANNFANWMQQSYVPVGGLGDVTRFVSVKLTAGNQDTKSLPQSVWGHREDLHGPEVRRRPQSRARFEQPFGLERQRERRLRRTRVRTQHAGAVLLHAPEVRRTGTRTTAMSSRRPWTSRRTRCSGGSRRTSTETRSAAIRSPSCSPRTTGCRS